MNDFFKILESKTADGCHEFIVDINKEHKVFEGHFPGNPVVPGVMSMMMIRKCAETIIGRKTRFATISQCKYHNVIIPDGRKKTIKVSVDETLTLKGEINDETGAALLTIKGTLV